MATNVELEFKYLAIEEMSVTWQSVFFVATFSLVSSVQPI